MRHRVDKIKLGRTMAHKRAMFRNMVTSLIDEERIKTTLARAKELRRIADRMVTLGKRGTLQARRRAASYVRTDKAVRKLFSELAGRFKDRKGGYTRVVKLGVFREGDSAPMALVEYLGAPLLKLDMGEGKKVSRKDKKKKKKGKKGEERIKVEKKEAIPEKRFEKEKGVKKAFGWLGFRGRSGKRGGEK